MGFLDSLSGLAQAAPMIAAATSSRPQDMQIAAEFTQQQAQRRREREQREKELATESFVKEIWGSGMSPEALQQKMQDPKYAGKLDMQTVMQTYMQMSKFQEDRQNKLREQALRGVMGERAPQVGDVDMSRTATGQAEQFEVPYTFDQAGVKDYDQGVMSVIDQLGGDSQKWLDSRRPMTDVSTPMGNGQYAQTQTRYPMPGQIQGKVTGQDMAPKRSATLNDLMTLYPGMPLEQLRTKYNELRDKGRVQINIDPNSPTRGATTEWQTAIGEMGEIMTGLDYASEIYKDGFSTLGGQVRAGAETWLNKLGIPMSDFSKGQKGWVALADQMFQQFRKWATGVQAGVVELKWLEATFPNSKDPPDVYREKTAVTKEKMRRLTEYKKGLLANGLGLHEIKGMPLPEALEFSKSDNAPSLSGGGEPMDDLFEDLWTQ